MRFAWISTILAVALCMSGCVVVSLHPLYTDQDLVFDPELLGTWGDDDETLTFTRAGDKGYLILVESTGEPNRRFEAHLLRLGPYRFLDTCPVMRDDRDGYEWHLIQGHMFFKVRLGADELALDPIAHSWVQTHLKENKLNIAYEELSDEIVLTASTPELQKFVLGLARQQGAFEEDKDNAFHRLK